MTIRRHTARVAAATAGCVAAAVAVVVVLSWTGGSGAVVLGSSGPSEGDRPGGQEDSGPAGPHDVVDASRASASGGPRPRSDDLEAQVPIEVLAARFLPSPRVSVTDLEAGEARSYAPDPRGLAREPLEGAVLTDVGLVVWQDATVRVFPTDGSGPSLVHTPADLGRSTPEDAAPAVSALPTVDGESLWVVQPGGCCADASPGQAELVDLYSGETRATTELPPSSRPVAAVRGGLVLDTLSYEEAADGWVGEEGSHRVLLLTEEGDVTALGSGEALAATDRHAAVADCEQHEPRADCRLDLIDLATAERVEVPAPADGTWGPVGLANVPTNTPPWPAVSRGGRVLVSLDGEPSDPGFPHRRTRRLVAVDTTEEAGPSATVLHELEGKHLSAAWDQAGEHVVVADDTGPHLTVVDPADGSSFEVRDAIPDDHYLLGMH